VRLSADIVGATVEITPDGGAAGAAAKLEEGGFVRFTLLVKDVARQRRTGTLIASSGKTFQTLADLVVTRPPAAKALSIEGAGDDGLERTSDAERVQLALSIVSSQRDDVDDLRVAVTPFTGETQDQVRPEVKLNGQENKAGTVSTIKGNDVLTLDISVLLPAGGVWTSSVRLIYGGQTTIVPIKITRNRVAPTVVFDEVPEVRESTGLTGGTDVKFRVHATENGGRTLDLQFPALILKRADGTAFEQAKFDHYTVNGRAAGPTRFTPGEPQDLIVKVVGLHGAGEFAATLRFRGAGGDPKDVVTKAWLRVCWFWALLTLIVAVLVGERVRQLRAQRLVALGTQAELAQLNDRLEQAARSGESTIEEQEVLNSLREFIAELYGRVDRKPEVDVAKERAELEAKLLLLGRWLGATRDARKANWPGDSRVKLASVGQFLMTRGEADPKDVQLKLQQAELLLRAGPGVGDALDELNRAALEWLAGPQVSEKDRKSMTEAIEDAKTKLRGGLVTEADKAYDDAAAQLANLAASGLLALITPTAPPGVDQHDWETLREDLTQASARVGRAPGPKEAIAAYREAYARYLQVISEGLQKVIESRHAELTTEQGRDGEALGLAEVAKSEALIESAVSKAKGGSDLAGARQDYEAAREQIATLKQAGRMGGQAVEPVSSASAVEIPSRGTGGHARPSILIPTGAVADRKRSQLERRLTYVAALASAASGLLVLYAPNPGWGSAQDFLIAALWGAGVHTVANATFQSVPTVLSRFGTGAA